MSGLPLRKFQVDSYTVSELVRLHLLGSGFERLQVTARFDYQQRGGYDSVDDPALDFRRRDMTVLKTLAEMSIFNLSPGSPRVYGKCSLTRVKADLICHRKSQCKVF